VTYHRVLKDFPAPDWKLTYWLAGDRVLSTDAVPDADNVTFRIRVEASDTSSLNATAKPVIYRYVERLTNQLTGEVRDLSSGAVQVNPNIASLAPGQTKSSNQKILDALLARLEGRITQDAESYSIAGRSIARMPVAQVAKMVGTYRYLVYRELNPPTGIGESVKVYFPEPDHVPPVWPS